MSEALVIVAWFVVCGLVLRAIIRADARAEEAQRRWYERADQPWNPVDVSTRYAFRYPSTDPDSPRS